MRCSLPHDAIAIAERLLVPGRPARGYLATQLSNTATFWNPQNFGNAVLPPAYIYEPFYLYLALMHAGYTVDFVDGTAIERNLVSNQYTTTQLAIKDWVQAGGTLVVLPGAAVRDEYNALTDLNNQSTVILDQVLGLRPRGPDTTSISLTGARWQTPARSAFTSAQKATLTIGSLVPSDCQNPRVCPPLTSGTTMPFYGNNVTDLVRSGASSLATASMVGTGQIVDAITVNTYGSGRAFAYAFYPGYEYAMTGAVAGGGLPLGYEAARRTLAAAPIRVNTPSPVQVDQPMVEVLRVDSTTPTGTAIVLLNWTGRALGSVTVSIPGAGALRTVSTIEQSHVTTSVDAGGNRIVTLPLKTVDVIMLDP